MTPQELYLKLKASFPEDPDQIKAEREAKKKAEDEYRKKLLKVRNWQLSKEEGLKKAREVRSNNRGKA